MKRVLFTVLFSGFIFAAQAQAPSQSLTKSILKKDLATAQTLLTAGADPNAGIEVVPGFPTTCLITAASNNSLDLVKLLLKHQAQVNQADGFKSTALMAAAGKGNKEMVELLLGSGADVKAKDEDGKDALALAKESGNQEVIALLEQRQK